MIVKSVQGRGFLVTVALLAGAGTMVTGVWALGWPRSFADLVDFPYHEHFLHDIGAFQLGMGTALLLACVWYDAMATALAGFLVGNTVHTVNHGTDLDHGGQSWHIAVLALTSVLVAVALIIRLRQLGWVTGGVTGVAVPRLAPYVRQKTVLLTTYRRDGRHGRSPVSIAVDGEHAYIRSFEKSVKSRRLRNDPAARIAPCSMRGTPLEESAAGEGGPAAEELALRLRRVTPGSAEERRARQVLRTKYPVLHGVLVPLAHRVLRGRTGATVHFVAVPAEAGADDTP